MLNHNDVIHKTCNMDNPGELLGLTVFKVNTREDIVIWRLSQKGIGIYVMLDVQTHLLYQFSRSTSTGNLGEGPSPKLARAASIKSASIEVVINW
jgi:hypothetical protein